jgi:hypothetical protein
MAFDDRNRARGGRAQHQRRAYCPLVERLESRHLLSFADGNGPVVAGVTAQVAHSGTTVVVSFDGPRL